jgi:class 3 adenylate cyclase
LPLTASLVKWTAFTRPGFTDGHIAVLKRIVPYLALAIKSVALARMTQTLMETYLGRDAGRRVLGGRIVRGIAEQIDAVVWFSDLRGFTRITDTAPEHVISLLNDYSDAVFLAIHKHGGDVLKLIGDGTLAIFTAEDRMHACNAALSAAIAARRAVAELKKRRAAEGKPVTDMYLGLHVGEVVYGNVGSRERLDFTVIGPAVNEASRIAAMCRSIDQPVLISASFAEVGDIRRRLVSVGRYALRGVSHPQELFTLDPRHQPVHKARGAPCPRTAWRKLESPSTVRVGHRHLPMPSLQNSNPPYLHLRFARRSDHGLVGGGERRALALRQSQIEAVVNRMTQVRRQFEGPFRKLFERNNTPIVGDGDSQLFARLPCGHIIAKDSPPDGAADFSVGERRSNQIVVRRSDCGGSIRVGFRQNPFHGDAGVDDDGHRCHSAVVAIFADVGG